MPSGRAGALHPLRQPARRPDAGPDGAGPLAGLGLVTALENATAVPDGALVATVTLGDGAGQRWRADLVAGRDTAEGDVQRPASATASRRP